MADRIIIASDSTSGAESLGLAATTARAIELERGVVVAGAGIWATIDGAIDTPYAISASFRPGDSSESFIQRFDHLHRQRLEKFLTDRFQMAPDVVLQEFFCPLMPPLSLVICEASAQTRWASILEYIPRLSGENQVTVTPLIHQQDPANDVVCAAIGPAAPYVHLPDPQYIRQALDHPNDPEHVARLLVEEALVRMPAARRPAVVHTYRVGPGRPRSRRVRPTRITVHAHAAANPADSLPAVDTKSISAVEQFVADKFTALYPDATAQWLPRLFRDVGDFFTGANPDYAPIDLRYHDLEHTLQATVCLALLMAGQAAARVPPRLDAHHFELAITAALLHDTGYLKLRSDTKGTGAKYTFCHVLRGCAFAASYLPHIGATGTDLETVLSAINCTGPASEMGRLRFQAPSDETIGCMVATADFLGQMAAPDYVGELGVLYEEFQESDDFLHLPPDQRAFKSAASLVARTPDFWRRFVLPKLEADFHGVYKFLARPYPGGRNVYLDAIEANIRTVERQLREPTQILTQPNIVQPSPAPSETT